MSELNDTKAIEAQLEDLMSHHKPEAGPMSWTDYRIAAAVRALAERVGELERRFELAGTAMRTLAEMEANHDAIQNVLIERVKKLEAEVERLDNIRRVGL